MSAFIVDDAHADATYQDDLPLDMTRAAHAGTSFTPEVRGDQERAGYAATLAKDFAHLERYATTDEKRATLADEFARYRAGYRDRMIAWLRSRSRCLSVMITGGSNFPTRRNEKRNSIADRRCSDLVEYRTRALAAIVRKLTPELQPIMSGDADAVERLQVEIVKAEQAHARMKAVNAAIRKARAHGAYSLQEAQSDALKALGCTSEQARQLLAPDFMKRIGFPSYAINNSGAEIRRMKERLATLQVAKATPDAVSSGANGVRFEDSPADNRVRLFFPGKPADQVRTELKAHGFRWAPSLGCWQAYRNPRSLEHAKRCVS
jgi:hypothetical protein